MEIGVFGILLLFFIGVWLIDTMAQKAVAKFKKDKEILTSKSNQDDKGEFKSN